MSPVKPDKKNKLYLYIWFMIRFDDTDEKEKKPAIIKLI